jgi:hypothetical protein
MSGRVRVLKPTSGGGIPRDNGVSGDKAQSVEPARFAEPTAESRYRLIAELAYFKAQQRGFAPGHELEDWLAAEAEADMKLGRG